MYTFLGTSQDAEYRQQRVALHIFSSIQKTDEEKYFWSTQAEGRKGCPLPFKTGLGQNPCSKTSENILCLWQKSNLREEIKLILH